MRVAAFLVVMTALVLTGVWHAAGVGPEPLPAAPPRGDLGPGFTAVPQDGIASAAVAMWVFTGAAALILLVGVWRRYGVRRAAADPASADGARRPVR